MLHSSVDKSPRIAYTKGVIIERSGFSLGGEEPLLFCFDRSDHTKYNEFCLFELIGKEH